jgi:hypothetical protein
MSLDADPHASRIFICYRRSDAEDAAGRLASELIRRVPLSENEVFVDIDALRVGETWKQRIHDTIVSLDALIALISRDWVAPADDGQLRIRKASDPVRVELETAFEAGVPVLPVLVGGARMPRPSELPKSLRQLPDLHAIELRHDHYGGDVQKLVGDLKAQPRAAARAPVSDTPLDEERSPFGEPFGLRPIGAWPVEDRRAWFAKADERVMAEEVAKAKRRLTEPAFYERPGWWLAGAVTFVATLVAVVASELMLDWLAGLLEMTSLSTVGWPIFPAYALAWAVTYVALATAFYVDDPGRGTRVFYTRGLFGGWVLAFDDVEEGAGLPAAFPINILVAWIGARLLASGLDWWLDVDQIGFFLLILGIVTTVAITMYVLNTLDVV